MRKGFLGALAVLAAGSGFTFGQSYNPIPPGAAPAPERGRSLLPLPGLRNGLRAPRESAPPQYGPVQMPGGGDPSADYTRVQMPPGAEGGMPPGAGMPMGPGGFGPMGPGGFGAEGPYGPMGPGGFDPSGMGGFDPMGPPPFGPEGGDPNMGENPRGVLPGLFRGGYSSRRFWASADYLYWTIRDMPIQFPLATTSSAFGIDFGQVGGVTTAPLDNLDRPISFDSRNGYRGFIGGTIDEAGVWGGEIGGFYMQTFNSQFVFQSSQFGVPLLAVPFIDGPTGQPGSYIVSFAGINTGSIRIGVQSRVWGAEANGIYNVSASPDGPGGLTILAGPRFFELREQFDLNTGSTTFGVPPAGGALNSSFFPGGGGQFGGAFFGPGLAPYVVTTTDTVRTVNDFYAGQVGFRGDIGWGGAFIGLTGKVAGGYMRSYVDLEGGSSLGTNGVWNPVPGGLFNAAPDLGRYRSDQFAVLLEGGLNVGYYLTPFLRLQGGYTFMWVNNVLRATSSLSPYVNPAQTPTSPAYTGAPTGAVQQRNPINLTEFDLHGFNVGLQLTF